jgi:hypothetical protein
MPQGTMAVAHDNDLQFIDSPTGVAVEYLLREKNIPVLVENGGMCLVTLQVVPQRG